MKICKLICSGLLATLSMISIQASAGNVNASAARLTASNFLKQHAASSPGTLRAPAMADIKLAHAQASSKVSGAVDYYAFNIDGGGFIIIAGEDRATPVLGYSDKGRIDFNNLPAPLQDLLNGYKHEIEFLQTYSGNDLEVVTPTLKASTGDVGPLIKSTWGQEMPYYLQCPMYQGEYSVVGCVATAMAQVMNYWCYPTSMPAISRYYCSNLGAYVPALPATTIDYSLILDSYCHWDWDNSQLVQDVYTDEQAQEVAKLGRYCGQAVQMGYSPEGSGAYTYNQLSAMKSFGYSNASNISKGSNWGWGGNNYTTAQWEAILKEDLDAGLPILYSANDQTGGHAFICDGYNSDGYFHFNLGWYGTCDGWYLTTSLKMVHRDGDQLNFNSGHEIVYKLNPPTYLTLNTSEVTAGSNLLVLGDQLNTIAKNVTFNTSYNTFNLSFSLINESGDRVASGGNINITKNTFEQGSDVEGAITLPTTLTSGSYRVQLDYNTTTSRPSALNQSEGQLVVVGNIAKYNGAFDVTDVTTLIGYILNDHTTAVTLDVSDVTQLINYILNH